MIYKVEVFDDGDIFVTKTASKKEKTKYLYFDSEKKLRDELIEYGVNEIDKNINSIASTKMNKPVQCY